MMNQLLQSSFIKDIFSGLMRVRKSFGVVLMISSSIFMFANPSTDKIKEHGIIFPRGIGVNVGQVGWMEGSSEDPVGGPWRAGIRRNFDVRDYQPIVEVGERLGIRIMSLFILGEFDRLNILGEYPTSNPAGKNWDNTRYISPTQIEIMDYVKSNAANMELGITGVLHEYWEDGVKSRAEWFDVANQQPRDENIIRNNVELIKRILNQYGISPENGHSFPESFIAYGFYFNPEGPYSLGKVLSENGIKYANTPFATIHGLKRPPLLSGGFDHGVLLLDRFNHGNLWYDYGAVPSIKPDEIQTVVVESHWANWLAYDDFLQPDVNAKWVDFLLNIQRDKNHYLAKNTEQLYSQWLYKNFTKVTEKKQGEVLIDNKKMLQNAYDYNLLGNMVLAVALDENEHISDATINNENIPAYYETEGFAYLYLPPLEQKTYTLKYAKGKKPIQNTVLNNGSYNVYQVRNSKSAMEIDLKMYGMQTVKIRVPKPISIDTYNKHLRILSSEYDKKESILYIKLDGRDIQGEKGTLLLKF